MALRISKYLVLLFFLAGCDTIKTEDRVIYEDQTPVKGVKMVISNDNYTGITYTDEDGIFSFIVPPDIEVKLCAYPLKWGACCFDEYLFTPLEDGGLISIER